MTTISGLFFFLRWDQSTSSKMIPLVLPDGCSSIFLDHNHLYLTLACLSASCAARPPTPSWRPPPAPRRTPRPTCPPISSPPPRRSCPLLAARRRAINFIEEHLQTVRLGCKNNTSLQMSYKHEAIFWTPRQTAFLLRHLGRSRPHRRRRRSPSSIWRPPA